jgi:MtN3 and saliva related transmembrane protein
MINPDFFAYTATGLNIVMLVPQVVQTWKTRQTKDLSLFTLIIFIVAGTLWMIYGIEKQALPIIVSNVVVTILNLILMTIKLTSQRK